MRLLMGNMQSILIIDDATIANLRNAGYQCELESDVEPLGKWYTTDCPIHHGTLIAGCVMRGTIVLTEEGYQQGLLNQHIEKARKLHEAHLLLLEAYSKVRR